MTTEHQKRVGAAGRKAWRAACSVSTFKRVFKEEMKKANGFHDSHKHGGSHKKVHHRHHRKHHR